MASWSLMPPILSKPAGTWEYDKTAVRHGGCTFAQPRIQPPDGLLKRGRVQKSRSSAVRPLAIARAQEGQTLLFLLAGAKRLARRLSRVHAAFTRLSSAVARSAVSRLVPCPHTVIPFGARPPPAAERGLGWGKKSAVPTADFLLSGPSNLSLYGVFLSLGLRYDMVLAPKIRPRGPF